MTDRSSDVPGDGEQAHRPEKPERDDAAIEGDGDGLGLRRIVLRDTPPTRDEIALLQSAARDFAEHAADFADAKRLYGLFKSVTPAEWWLNVPQPSANSEAVAAFGSYTVAQVEEALRVILEEDFAVPGSVIPLWVRPSGYSLDDCRRAVGPGWRALAERAWHAAQAHRAAIVQVKQKFDVFTVYVAPPQSAALNHILGELATISTGICEVCGDPLTILRTRHDECINVRWWEPDDLDHPDWEEP